MRALSTILGVLTLVTIPAGLSAQKPAAPRCGPSLVADTAGLRSRLASQKSLTSYRLESGCVAAADFDGDGKIDRAAILVRVGQPKARALAFFPGSGGVIRVNTTADQIGNLSLARPTDRLEGRDEKLGRFAVVSHVFVPSESADFCTLFGWGEVENMDDGTVTPGWTSVGHSCIEQNGSGR